MAHTSLHTDLGGLLSSFRYDAHPCGMFISAVSALGTFYPEANPALSKRGPSILKDNSIARDTQIKRILGKVPSIAAQTFRHRIGRPYNAPWTLSGDPHPLDFTAGFLYMMDRLGEGQYKPNAEIAKCLDEIWILHAEHGLNCSTATLRQLASTGVDPYTAVAGAAAALYGPLHGGANEQVLKMLSLIGTTSSVTSFIKKVKKEKRVLFGFGHRVYKSPDPRAIRLKQIATRVFRITGEPPLWSVALELEKQVLADSYFNTRHLYPNVDFYSGLIYAALDFPPDFFPVLFAVPLTAGWLAHYVEQLQQECQGEGNGVVEPNQIFIGGDMAKSSSSSSSSSSHAASSSYSSSSSSPSSSSSIIPPIAFRSSSLSAPASNLYSGFDRRRQLGTNYDPPRSKL